MPFVLPAFHLFSAPRTPSAVRSMPKANTKRASISFGFPTQESAYSKNTPKTNTAAKTVAGRPLACRRPLGEQEMAKQPLAIRNRDCSTFCEP